MNKLRKYFNLYKEDPKRLDREIEEAESKIIKKVKKAIKPIFVIHKKSKNPVNVYKRSDVSLNLGDRYLRIMGLEKYSKLHGQVVSLYKSKRTGKRYGVIVG